MDTYHKGTLNSVILASYLHDIGKPFSRRLFLAGRRGAKFFSHPEKIKNLLHLFRRHSNIAAFRHIVYGLAFIREVAITYYSGSDESRSILSESCLLDTPEVERSLWSKLGFDIDLVKAAILLHHNKVNNRDEFLNSLAAELEFPVEVYKQYYWAVDIIRMADHDSARVQRTRRKDSTQSEYLLNILRLLNRSSPSASFDSLSEKSLQIPPVSLTSWKRLKALMFDEVSSRNPEVLNEILDGTVGIVHTLLSSESVNDQIDTKFLSLLDILLKRTLYYTPSSYLEYAPVVSLYEHLYATASLASIMYMMKTSGESKLHVAVMDFSGVQGFIYDLWSNKSAAKILRARSILVSLVLEAIKLRFYEFFGLPFVVELLNTGGKISFLLPDMSGDLESQFEQFKQEVEAELFRLYGGRLIVNLALSDGLELKSEDNPTPRVVDSLVEVIQDAMRKLKLAKSRPFYTHIVDSHNGLFKKTDDTYLVFHESWHKAASAELCAVCGRNPGTKELEEADGRVLKVCEVCDTLMKFGGRIAKVGSKIEQKGNKYLPFLGFVRSGSEKETWSDATSLELPFFNVRIYKKGSEDIRPDYLYSIRYTIPKLARSKDRAIASLLSKSGPVFYNPISTYVPRNSSGVVKAFEELAYNSETKEQDYLAVLKLDMDNLGTLFGSDIKDLYSKLMNQGVSGESRNSQYALSYMRTASHWIKLFFEIYIPAFISSEEGREFSSLYMVYAGGDDLVILGRWDKVVKFLRVLETKWREYLRQSGGGKGRLHFSAAVTLFKESSPVLKAIETADDALTEAKSYEGKNRVYFLVEPVLKDIYISIVDEVDSLLSDIAGSNDPHGERLPTTLMYRLYKLLDSLPSPQDGSFKEELFMLLVYIMYLRKRRLKNKNKDKDRSPETETSEGEQKLDLWLLRYLDQLYNQLKTGLHGYGFSDDNLSLIVGSNKALLAYLLYRFRQARAVKVDKIN